MSHEVQIYKCILPKLKKLEAHDRWNTERVLRMLLADEHFANYNPNEQKEYKAERDKNPEAYAKKIKELKIDGNPKRFCK